MQRIHILKLILGLVLCCSSLQLFAQQERIDQIRTHLESLVVDAPGLTKKVEFNVNNVLLADFLQAMAASNKINLNINSDLDQISIKNNFSNISVADVLLYLCKEHELTIDFTGNILAIRKFKVPTPEAQHRIIPMSYELSTSNFSIDLQNDSLYVAFKQIMDKTGKNLVFAPGMDKLRLKAYIKQMPFDTALDKIAFANNLNVSKTRDNFYLFEPNEDFEQILPPSNTASRQASQKPTQNQPARPQRSRRSNFYFEVTDSISKTLNVDFENTAIATVINDIGHELNKSMFTAYPLTEAGRATVKADNISYNHLLDKILENTEFTYKKTDDIYYFGKKDQISLRDAITVPLMHRSIEVMSSSGGSGRRAGRISGGGFNNYNRPNNFSGAGGLSSNNNFNNNRQNLNTDRGTAFQQTNSQLESLVNMLPEDVIKDLKVSVDIELNSFIVSGPSQNIERFKAFIEYIDKPVPVILIEVMLLEVNKTATVETGISWGLGTEPTATQGGVYPTTDLTLGANSVNRIIGGFNGFGSWNLGQVVPNFFAKIKAMETNGDVKIRSAPKLSALNGHRATLSIGETTYYAVTQRDIIGSQNPQTSTITNYQPIDAEFAINIKPLVSGDGQITLDINVIQSSFNGNKVAEDAPPGVNSREFNSIIRVKDQDMVILGGLEEKIKNDTGTGVPFLARIPILKWFFSKKKREDTRKKLTVLIKPTIIK